MTQFTDLVLDWNRGDGWEPPRPPADWTAFAAAELPLTDGCHLVPAGVQRARDLEAATAAGCITIASHTISIGEFPDDQAGAAATALTDRRTPLLILPPPIPSVDAFDTMMYTVESMLDRGMNPAVLYMPEFYWHAIGSPSMVHAIGFRSRWSAGLAVMIEPADATWSLDPSGAPLPAYPGDDSPQWRGYGGLRDRETLMRVPGTSLAAFRGTREEFAELLNVPPAAASSPPTTPAATPPAAAA